MMNSAQGSAGPTASKWGSGGVHLQRGACSSGNSASDSLGAPRQKIKGPERAAARNVGRGRRVPRWVSGAPGAASGPVCQRRSNPAPATCSGLAQPPLLQGALVNIQVLGHLQSRFTPLLGKPL